LGDPTAFELTKPKVDDYNFSFSGLKTNFRNFVERETRRNPDFITENMNDLCASLQHTIIEMLMDRLTAAAKAYHIDNIALAGGVSANKGLRDRLEAEAKIQGWKTFIPPFEFCTDNAAMIGITGYYDYLNNERGGLSDAATARWKME
jgi:N6-L-threonylcarbamoyladenine synthase